MSVLFTEAFDVYSMTTLAPSINFTVDGLLNVGDEGMAQDSKYSIWIVAMTGKTGEPMAAPYNCL